MTTTVSVQRALSMAQGAFETNRFELDYRFILIHSRHFLMNARYLIKRAVLPIDSRALMNLCMASPGEFILLR